MVEIQKIKAELAAIRETKIAGTGADVGDNNEKFQKVFDGFLAKFPNDGELMKYYEAMKKQVPWLNTPSDFAQFFADRAWQITRNGKIITAR